MVDGGWWMDLHLPSTIYHKLIIRFPGFRVLRCRGRLYFRCSRSLRRLPVVGIMICSRTTRCLRMICGGFIRMVAHRLTGCAALRLILPRINAMERIFGFSISRLSALGLIFPWVNTMKRIFRFNISGLIVSIIPV